MRRKLKNGIRLQSKISLQLWKTYMIMGASIGHAKLLNIKILVKEIIRLFELKSYKPWYLKEV
jgi:hypothetical protein